MKIQAPEKVVDGHRPPVVTIDAVEDIARGLYRQRWNLRTFAVPGDCRDAGSDTDAYGWELTQFFYNCVDLLMIRPLRVEDRLGAVKDYDHLLGGEQGSQGSHILQVFDPRTDDLREAGEEMRARSGELIAADESAVIAKSFLDPIIVEDSEGNRRFSDSPCTDQSDGFEVFSQSDDLVDQLSTSETGPWCRGR